MGLDSAEFCDVTAVDGGGNDVAQGIGGVVATQPRVVDIGLEHIGRVVRVVLQIGERVEEAAAALMDEEGE